DLKTFQPAACCLRSGFSLFCNASFNLPMTISKSAVLSGLMKIRIMPPSFGNSRGWETDWACCAGACACATVADSKLAINPRANTADRRAIAGASLRNIAASCVRKGATLTYSRLNKNRHYLMSEEHPGAGQPPPGVCDLQQPNLNETLQILAETGPGVDLVPRVDASNIHALGQTQRGKKCVSQTLLARQASDVEGRRLIGAYPSDII